MGAEVGNLVLGVEMALVNDFHNSNLTFMIS